MSTEISNNTLALGAGLAILYYFSQTEGNYVIQDFSEGIGAESHSITQPYSAYSSRPVTPFGNRQNVAPLARRLDRIEVHNGPRAAPIAMNFY